MKCTPRVDARVAAMSSRSAQKLLDVRQWMVLPLGDAVKATECNTQAVLTVLLNCKCRMGEPRSIMRFDDPCLEHLLNFLIDESSFFVTEALNATDAYWSSSRHQDDLVLGQVCYWKVVESLRKQVQVLLQDGHELRVVLFGELGINIQFQGHRRHIS